MKKLIILLFLMLLLGSVCFAADGTSVTASGDQTKVIENKKVAKKSVKRKGKKISKKIQKKKNQQKNKEKEIAP